VEAGKGKDNHGLADQLLNLLQALTGTEGETTFIRDIGFNFPLLETLESVRSKLYLSPRFSSVPASPRSHTHTHTHTQGCYSL
jgi:hypothetical protein